MPSLRVLPFLLLLSTTLRADLTVEQKTSDFVQLAGQYAKNYAPYELKRDVFGFDLYALQPWLQQVKASKSDVEFFDICTRYVASLQDSHDEFISASDFDAWLHFDADIYDGKLLIDSIDRAYLPLSRFPFRVGDELLTVDGVAVADLIQRYQPYSFNGASNPVSRSRLAAATITERLQSVFPGAINIGKTATIELRRASTGNTETYSIPWDIQGTPVTTAGILQSPSSRGASLQTSRRPRPLREPAPTTPFFYRKGLDSDDPRAANPWGIRQGGQRSTATSMAGPPFPKSLLPLRHFAAKSFGAQASNVSSLFPFGNPFPVFNPPGNFSIRLGLSNSDFFFSGIFPVGAYKIGFIRIPDMDPGDELAAALQFGSEISYMQKNTDGLVIDVMANGGGDGCYTQQLVSYLMPGTFRGLAEEVRATLGWQETFSFAITELQLLGAPDYKVQVMNMYLNDIKAALTQNRARTGSLPACDYTFDAAPAKDSKGNIVAYTKPILVLTDNFTLSAGEIFAMMLQDEGRATLFGTRTDGGGGVVTDITQATSYSEGETRVTLSLVTRKNPVTVPGFPALNYYDGIGIQPDIVQDYQTVSNLSTGGTPFVTAFSSAIADLVTKSKAP